MMSPIVLPTLNNWLDLRSSGERMSRGGRPMALLSTLSKSSLQDMLSPLAPRCIPLISHLFPTAVSVLISLISLFASPRHRRHGPEPMGVKVAPRSRRKDRRSEVPHPVSWNFCKLLLSHSHGVNVAGFLTAQTLSRSQGRAPGCAAPWPDGGVQRW